MLSATTDVKKSSTPGKSKQDQTYLILSQNRIITVITFPEYIKALFGSAQNQDAVVALSHRILM